MLLVKPVKFINMLNKKIEDICNRQVEREGYSSNLYLAMASWAEIQRIKWHRRLDVYPGG